MAQRQERAPRGGLAERTIMEMRAHGIEPNPQNYAIWYAYCSRSNPELVGAVSGILAEGGRFTAQVSEELYATFFAAEKETKSLRHASRKLQETLSEVLSFLDSANLDTARYGERLASFSGEMKEGPSSTRISGLIHEILNETEVVLARTRSLETQITRSTEEVGLLRRDLATLKREAATDALTALPNRKRFEEALRQAASSTSSEGSLSLVMLDVDNFKRFNDTYGHRIGDEALRLVARLIRSAIRTEDLPARYGGEEFAVLLPATGLGEALQVAERIRAQLAQRKLTNRSTGKQLGTVTISAGVATYRRGESLDLLVERADGALYLAKHLGRNRVADEGQLRQCKLPPEARRPPLAALPQSSSEG